MKILLLGKNGQVGWELQRALAPLGSVLALDRQGHDGLCGDLSDLQGLTLTLHSVRPDVIVNAAAWTAVDKAESEHEMAHRINAEAPRVLAEFAAQSGALLVHYSTDYVFNGSGEQPWQESDTTAPLNVYGASKLAGERVIQASGCRHLIFRTAWVYAARGGNFAKTMLRLATERAALKVIDDQWGAPTGADLIADVTAHALRTVQRDHTLGGLYHLVAAGETTWHRYARFVLAVAQQQGRKLMAGPAQVEAVNSDAFPTPAKRPLNSRLSTQHLQTTFDLVMPPWEIGVQRMLEEILN